MGLQGVSVYLFPDLPERIQRGRLPVLHGPSQDYRCRFLPELRFRCLLQVAERVPQHAAGSFGIYSPGGAPAGTSQAVSGGTKLAAYPADIFDAKAHLTALAERFAAYGKLAREAINVADEAGDKDTADLFTGVSRQIDKDLWFIEAHLG